MLADPTVFEDEDLVGQQERVGGVVGDQKPWTGVVGEMAREEPAQLGVGRHIECREWFVEEQQVGIGCEGARQCHPLGLPSREFRRPPPFESVEFELVDPPVGHGACVALGNAAN